MLKTSYDAESEIPENQRGAYVARDGKFVLDDLADDHPVLVSKKAALADKSKAVTKAEGLEADLAEAKRTSLQRGHVAVSKSDADMLEKLKGLGTADEIAAKLAEHHALTEKVTKQEQEAHLREVAKLLSYEAEAFVRLQNLPEFEIRDGNDGQKTVVAKLKDTKGVITEKPAQEFVESSIDIAPFLPALKAKGNGGTKVHGTSGGGGTPPKDTFTRIRDDVKQKQNRSEADLNPMFSKIPGRVVASAGE